ncbi:MAG: ChaB family protein [Bradyrhizobium sp.]
MRRGNRCRTALIPIFQLRSATTSHAPDIYRAAFNHAFAAHAGDVRQEEIAHRTAWAAVKRSYVKDGDHWVPIE